MDTLAPNTADFNPRHPYGWRPEGQRRQGVTHDFNPRHPYGWRPSAPSMAMEFIIISIHATHTGGDVTAANVIGVAIFISIHATHTGGDFTFFR